MFSGRRLLPLVFAAGGLCCVAAAATAQDDDFADGVRGSQWSLIEDVPAELFLLEQNSRLEVIANSPTSGATDALYLSNGPDGFQLSTASDFEIRINYALLDWDDSQAQVGDRLGLTFGVGRDLDGTDAAAIGIGLARQEVLGVPVTGIAIAEAHRTDDVQTENILNLFTPSQASTFEISYDAAGDDLTLGVGSDTFTLEDTVRAVWDADALFVSFGARGNGFSLGAQDAWLDLFDVVSGDVLPLTSTSGDYNDNGLVEQGDLNQVLNNWGVGFDAVSASWVSQRPTEGIVDQAELNTVLNNWGGGNAPDFAGSAVPEPGVAAALMAMVGVAGSRCSRRVVRTER